MRTHFKKLEADIFNQHLTSVAPDAKSCGSLRMFRLLWLLWEYSECFERKIWCGCIFGSPVAFSERRQLVGLFSQGAGELGPLGSAGWKMWLPKKQKHRNHCGEIDGWQFCYNFVRAFSKHCGGASVVVSSKKIHGLVSSAAQCLSCIFREQLLL